MGRGQGAREIFWGRLMELENGCFLPKKMMVLLLVFVCFFSLELEGLVCCCFLFVGVEIVINFFSLLLLFLTTKHSFLHLGPLVHLY